MSEINFQKVRYLIFDEADELVQKQATTQFVQNVRLLPNLSIAFFSATYSQESLDTIHELMGDRLTGEVMVETETYAGKHADHQVRQFALPLDKLDDKAMLVQQILDRLTFVQAVVFSNSQAEVDMLADSLKGHFSALPLHSGLDLSERVGNLKKFKTGQVRVLVTTDVFGRGMDLRSITLVVNAGLPRT